MDFKDIIKTRRSKLGLTLDDIARYVGVSGATVSRWESGDIENIRRDKIAKLAEVLQVTPAYLMGWEDESGTQDLGLTAIDIAKWLNTSPGIVDSVMKEMGWPDATNPEILSKISAEVERQKIHNAQAADSVRDHVSKEIIESIANLSDDDQQLILAMLKRMEDSGASAAGVRTKHGPWYCYRYDDSQAPPEDKK